MNTNVTKINFGKLSRIGAIAFATASLSVAGMIPSIPPAQAQTVPTCMEAKRTSGNITQSVKVTNKCSKEYRIQIIWAFGVDSPCVQLKPGYYYKHTVAIVPRVFSGLKFC